MFQKATKTNVNIKLAITGPSGSGKSYSALRLAKGLGGKIAVIDTENGSVSLYSDQFDFDVMNLTPPFITEKYIEAIKAAEKAGYDTIVIDSLTHGWAGEGGLLEQKTTLDSRPGSNSYTNWGPISKKDTSFKDSYLHSKCNIIATMRSKQDYLLIERNGKMVPQKVGMAPVQRDGIEYEFTIVFDVAMNHECQASKDRTGLFVDKVFQINEETGEQIKTWLTLPKKPSGTGGEATLNSLRESSSQKVYISPKQKSEGNEVAVSMTQSESKDGQPSESNSLHVEVKESLFDKVMNARPSVQPPPERLQVDASEPVDTITRVFELEPEYENNNDVHPKPNVTQVKFPADPGDYILPFKNGRGAGKKLKDIAEHDLKGTLKFCDEKGMDNIAVKIREYLNSIDSIPF